MLAGKTAINNKNKPIPPKYLVFLKSIINPNDNSKKPDK
tara:strand:+ start:204 stop:320 length:117 start_codon:yes stop_codon:yes gene_type:complete